MKAEYEKIKKSLTVKQRAKERNKISALESRIKKRQNQDKLNSELSSIKQRIADFASIIQDAVDDDVQDYIIKELAKGPGQKRPRGNPRF